MKTIDIKIYKLARLLLIKIPFLPLIVFISFLMAEDYMEFRRGIKLWFD